MKIKFKNYVKFVMLIFLIMFLVYLFISFISNNINFKEINTVSNKQGFDFTIDIIWNNANHFLQYFVLVVFSPILVILDIFHIVINYYISIQIRGIKETFLLSYKHGIMKQLLGQNQGATNVEIDKESIRDFEKLAKKYGEIGRAHV